jgi:integrase
MAHLVKIHQVRYVDRDGQRVPKGTAGARKVREKSAKWYGCGIPGQGKKRVPLATDKEAARRMLNELVKGAERGEARLPDRHAGRKSLNEYLTAFEGDLALGLASKGGRKRKPPSTAQVKLVVQRVRDIIGGCGLANPGDLNTEAPAKLAKYLHARLGKPRKGEEGISAHTATFFLAAARRFARWMAERAAVRPDLFDALPGFDPQHDRRHARREIGPAELAMLIDTARASGKTIRGLTGQDRAMLYLTAFATGYRAGELAELGPENFDLDAAIPVVVLPAQFTKNKKPARQPIPAGLAAQLREYLAGKRKGQPVWPGTWSERPVSVLCRDLTAAGVQYCLQTLDGPKYADFHALRHSYLSALAAAGVGVKELQTLARHADPRVTLGIYTHARVEALGAAVGRLELPGAGPTNPLARLTRAELEDAVVALAAVVRVLTGGTARQGGSLVAPRVALVAGITGDSVGRLGTGMGHHATERESA